LDGFARLIVQEHDAGDLGLDAEVLWPWVQHVGAVAVVDLETTGLVQESEAELVEFGAVLLDPGEGRVRTARSLVRPVRPLPPAIERLTGLSHVDLADAPLVAEIAEPVASLLTGRTLVAHNAEFDRHFLARCIAPALDRETYLDTLDLLSLTHPDAPDLRLETFVHLLLGSEERHRALDDALDTARVLSRIGSGARAEESRYRTVRRALESFAPESPWLALLGKEEFAPAEAAGDAPRAHPVGPAGLQRQYVEIRETPEAPVPFDEEAIAAALADEDRGRRYFPNYRVREEQIRLARCFVRNLSEGGVLLLEGGTGVGKSLAYLSAAIPFAMERSKAGERGLVAISTRTKLLQDQLLGKDIPAAARMLGHADLQALSIKGRANYVCARRLDTTLAEGREPSLFPRERLARAALLACARTRPYGEVGSVPGGLLRRFPSLRDLLRRSVSTRPEQCTREQCAHQKACPFGQRRAALARAQLVVANHDLLLRWPPDYPRFGHAIVDEAHELSDIADEVYAVEVRPVEILDRFDEIFGREADGGLGEALLPGVVRAQLAGAAASWRSALHQDLVALGRQASEGAEYGEVDLPPVLGPRWRAVGELAAIAAERIESVCDELERQTPDEADEGGTALDRARDDLRGSARGLRLPFEETGRDQVAAFESLETPFDRWRLVVRAVDPSSAFHAGFLERLDSFAAVSASLFVGGDAYAAIGELGIEERLAGDLTRDSVPSPFPYADHMRVVALESGGDLIGETAEVLAELALRLRGRTLGLFTSLRRMHEVAALLAPRLRAEGIEVLAPRRAGDDPRALVSRFGQGAAVLLGARRFWQGLDIPGPALQAVVIEKLPFEVPSELRRRREGRLRERGEDAFGRYGLGKMLLNLKQMVGRLIRTEEDRGIAVIVEGRTRMRYFTRLDESLPQGVGVRVVGPKEVLAVLQEVGIEGDEAS
jgi:ATP-dependent DNA helicase DinG